MIDYRYTCRLCPNAKNRSVRSMIYHIIEHHGRMLAETLRLFKFHVRNGYWQQAVGEQIVDAMAKLVKQKSISVNRPLTEEERRYLSHP